MKKKVRADVVAARVLVQVMSGWRAAVGVFSGEGFPGGSARVSDVAGGATVVLERLANGGHRVPRCAGNCPGMNMRSS